MRGLAYSNPPAHYPNPTQLSAHGTQCTGSAQELQSAPYFPSDCAAGRSGGHVRDVGAQFEQPGPKANEHGRAQIRKRRATERLDNADRVVHGRLVASEPGFVCSFRIPSEVMFVHTFGIGACRRCV